MAAGVALANQKGDDGGEGAGVEGAGEDVNEETDEGDEEEKEGGTGNQVVLKK